MATVGGFTVALAGFIWALFSRLEGRIDRVETTLSARIDGVETRLSRMESNSAEVKGRVDEQSGLLRQVLSAILPPRAA